MVDEEEELLETGEYLIPARRTNEREATRSMRATSGDYLCLVYV